MQFYGKIFKIIVILIFLVRVVAINCNQVFSFSFFFLRGDNCNQVCNQVLPFLLQFLILSFLLQFLIHQTFVWPWLSCCGLPCLAIDFFIRFGKIQLQFYKCDILKFSIRSKHIIRLKLIILKFMFIGQYDNILQLISLYIVGFCSNLLYILFDRF